MRNQISSLNFKIQIMENTMFANAIRSLSVQWNLQELKMDPTLVVKIVSKATTCLRTGTNNFLTKSNNK